MRRSTLAMAGVVLAAFAAGGCATPISSVTPTAPASEANGSPSPPKSDRFGPLAVVPATDGTDTARTEGTLRITDDCVFLEVGSEQELLIWPDARTEWDKDTEQISFTNFDGTVVRVGDATPVVLGGSGDSDAESGLVPGAWLANISWVKPPAGSCPLESRWFVGDLRSANP